MAEFATAPVVPPLPRVYHGANWTGFVTLYLKEVRRFWKVGAQTILGPVVTTLLYMMIFAVAVTGDTTFTQGGGAVLGIPVPYQLTIKNVGNLAIGNVVTPNNMTDAPANGEDGFGATNGDIGAIRFTHRGSTAGRVLLHTITEPAAGVSPEPSRPASAAA